MPRKIKLPSRLYHYCSLEAAIAILKSGKLRMSNVFYMNDKLEHRWLMDAAARYITSEYKRESHPVLYQLRQATKLKDDDDVGVYCACFSQYPDDLGQLRAYADDGFGIALGFDRAAFGFKRSPYSQKHRSTELCKVSYDPKRQFGEMRRLVDSARRAKRRSEYDIFFGDIYEALLGLAARCKHPTFKQEKEWRIVYRPMLGGIMANEHDAISTLGVTVRGHSLIPYFELPFEIPTRDNKAEPIKEFWLGPNVSKSTWRTLSLFLRHNFYRDILEIPSFTSYRTIR